MDGILSSFSKWFSEKTSSPLYFTYIGFFIAWNWKFFQIIFLESETLFYFPRIEYLSNLEWHPSGAVALDWLVNVIWRMFPPAIFTYFAIVYLPKLHKWALEKYLDSRFERKRIFELKQREYDEWLLNKERQRSKILEDIAATKEKQFLVEKKIEKAMSNEERWELEYEKFEKNKLFYKFKQIIETIYIHKGYIESGMERHANADALAIADTWGLTTYVGGNHNHIELTEKGKIFAKLYLEKHPNL